MGGLIARSGIFGNSLAWLSTNNVDLLTWWKGNFGAVIPELTKVAVRVLSIPTSSAAVERNWSTFSYVHVFKLVYIYINNKLKTQR
ncbi:8888_t:CDS:2 [Entrophospora sp. SA101]|nr:8888_t:CDS:2 [Entrophospora sp. SA101]